MASPIGPCERGRRYRESGLAGLAEKPRPGKPCQLSARQKEGLRKRRLKGARSEGFPTDLWTCPRIRQVILRRSGVESCVERLPSLRKSLGVRCQKPQLRAAERDEGAIATWIAKAWPRMKTRRSAAGAAGIRR